MRPGGSFLPGVKTQNSEYFPQKRRVKGAGIPMASQRVAQGSYPPPPQGKATLQSPRMSRPALGLPPGGSLEKPRFSEHQYLWPGECRLQRRAVTTLSHAAKRQRVWEPNMSGSDTPHHLLFPLFHGLLNVLSKFLEHSAKRRILTLSFLVLQHLPS